MAAKTLVWLRNDLRLSDNPALHAAVDRGENVCCVYVHEVDPVRRPGGAARWWIHHSLNKLAEGLAPIGVLLLVESGEAREVIPRLADREKADLVCWNRRYAPAERLVDEGVADALKELSIAHRDFAGDVLVEPWTIATKQGKPYSVYTPFWNSLRDRHIATPLPAPRTDREVAPERVDTDYRQPHWASKLAPYWEIGEAAAHRALEDFLAQKLDAYPLGRDFPAQDATSRLSVRLRHGEISPRQVWHAAQHHAHAEHKQSEHITKLLKELTWRDFNYHQLYYREDIAEKAMQPRYEAMRWREDEAALLAWQTGQTGIPIVDAGMRELWETGFMQNRVRMLTASLLVKNLLIDWRLGEKWFWDCLVDADIANNPANWQWVAGSGQDAAPFFRIFNPVTQGDRFDADGEYVRRWVPELAELPPKWIQRPADAPRDVLSKAGVRIGETYPEPIVDLKESRARALEAMKAI